MRKLFVATFLIVTALSGAALAAEPTCKVRASEKALAGAALKSFMTKCEKDAKAICDTSAGEKKLAGAAKNSFAKKCVQDSVGI